MRLPLFLFLVLLAMALAVGILLIGGEPGDHHGVDLLETQKIYLPFRISGGAVALLASMILFFGVSCLTKPKPLAADVEAVMDL